MLSTSQSYVTYQGNGAATSFPFNFIIPNAQSLVVSITNNTVNPPATTVLSASAYSVTGLGNTNEFTTGAGVGGMVTYNPSAGPLPVGWSITIQRVVSPIQQTSLSNQGAMYPQVIEGALDYLTMLQQQTNDAALLGTYPNMMSMLAGLGIGGGVWTPSLLFGGSGSGVAYSAQYGEYVTIGKLCIAIFYMGLTSKGPASGSAAASISGLPLAAGGASGGGGVVSCNNMYSVPASIIAAVQGGTTLATLSYQGATVIASITNSNFTNTSTLDCVMAYFTG